MSNAVSKSFLSEKPNTLMLFSTSSFDPLERQKIYNKLTLCSSLASYLQVLNEIPRNDVFQLALAINDIPEVARLEALRLLPDLDLRKKIFNVIDHVNRHVDLYDPFSQYPVVCPGQDFVYTCDHCAKNINGGYDLIKRPCRHHFYHKTCFLDTLNQIWKVPKHCACSRLSKLEQDSIVSKSSFSAAQLAPENRYTNQGPFEGLPVEITQAIAAVCETRDLGNLRRTSKTMNYLTQPVFKKLFETFQLTVNFQEDHIKAISFFENPQLEQLTPYIESLCLNLPPDRDGEWPREWKCIINETPSTVKSAMNACHCLKTIIIETMHRNKVTDDRCKYIAFLLTLVELSREERKLQVILRNVEYDGLAKICQIMATANQQSDAIQYLKRICSEPWLSWNSKDPINGDHLPIDTLRIPIYDLAYLEDVKTVLSGTDRLKHLVIDTYPGTLTSSAVACMIGGIKPCGIQSLLIDGCAFDETDFRNAYSESVSSSLTRVMRVNIEPWTSRTVAEIQHGHHTMKYINEHRRRGKILYLIESIRYSYPKSPDAVLKLQADVKDWEIDAIAWDRYDSQSTISMGQAILKTAKKFTYCQVHSGYVMLRSLHDGSRVDGWVSLADFFHHCGDHQVTSLAVIRTVKSALSDWIITEK